MRGFVRGLALLACCPASVLSADEQRLRVQIGYVSSPTALFQPDGVSLGAQSALGGRVSFEHLFTENFGLEVGVATSQHDFVASRGSGGTKKFDLRMTPLTLAGNLHFGDSDRVDPFFGAGLAYVTIGDYVPVGRSEEVSVDAELTWIVQYGIDIALGKRKLFEPLDRTWTLGLSLSYMQGEAGEGPATLSLETLSIHAGVTWRLP